MRDHQCHFCGKTLDPRGFGVDRHHLTCRRYYRKGQDCHTGNIVLACVEHHRRFHSEYDNPNLPLEAFTAYMQAINYGRNIYAPPSGD